MLTPFSLVPPFNKQTIQRFTHTPFILRLCNFSKASANLQFIQFTFISTSYEGIFTSSRQVHSSIYFLLQVFVFFFDHHCQKTVLLIPCNWSLIIPVQAMYAQVKLHFERRSDTQKYLYYERRLAWHSDWSIKWKSALRGTQGRHAQWTPPPVSFTNAFWAALE